MIELNKLRLSCGSWQAEILPQHGANLISLKNGDTPILRTPENTEAFLQAPVLFGNPLLLPPNRTKDGRFFFRGTEYQLPVNEPSRNNHIHGFIHTAPFQVTAATSSSAHCLLTNQGEWFPFPFELNVSFKLDENGLTQRFKITNIGPSSMPVLLGLHTTFCAPERFSVPIGKRWSTDTRYIPNGSLAELTEQERAFKTGCRSEGQVITGFYTAEGHTARIGAARYESSSNFTQWILFNQGGANGLLCVEPQSGCVNGLNMPGQHILLFPSESVEFWVRFCYDDEEC